MSSVYLLRHYQTTGQDPDSSLSQNGFQETESLTKFFNKLSIKKVVSSPFKRAQESIFPFISKNKIELKIDERLQERALGKSDTLPWQVMLENTFLDLDLKYPQG
jgi:2,3-bisphosphoglycerate-dependent phosphoglycerate mutase